MIDEIILNAKSDREKLLHDIAAMGAKVGEMKQERAMLLMENELDINAQDVQRLNEKIHNARRVITAWTKRREHLDFLLAYVTGEGRTANEF